jgi:hypothetical protein
VEAGRTVVIGAIRVLAKRGVPTNTVETAAYWLCRPDFKDRLPAEDLRAIRLAVSEAYPDLLAKIPEPEAKP